MRRLVALLLLLILVAGVAAVAVGSFSAREPDSSFSSSGGSASAFVADAEEAGFASYRLVSGPLALRTASALDAPRTLVLVESPSVAYTEEEAASLVDLVEAGGRLLVVDAFGEANSLTARFGVVFERVRLVETQADAALDVTLDGRPYTVMMTQPTALRIDEAVDADVLAASSAASFIDRDGNGVVDDADPRGPFPVMAQLAIGDSGGVLVVVAAPSTLSSVAEENEAAQAFRSDLMEYLLPDGGTLYVDEGSTASDDPVVLGVRHVVGVATSSPWRYVVAGLGALALLAAFLPNLLGEWGPHRFRPHRFRRRSDLEAAEESDEEPSSVWSFSAWTRRGVLAIGGALLLGAAGLVLGNVQATYAAGFLVALLGAALIPSAPRVRASRTLELEKTSEASKVGVDVEIVPTGRRRQVVEVRDELPEEFEVASGDPWQRVALRGRRPAPVSYRVSPAVRGPYRVGPLLVRTSDPLRFRVQQVTAEPGGRMLVGPRQEKVRKTPFATRRSSIIMGPHLVNRAGDGSEFHALRDYQPGDTIRMINWKASARSKDMVVNQRVHESMTFLTLVLDARAISDAGPADRSALARACRAAMSIADGALRVRDRVRAYAYGDGVKEAPYAPGMRQLHELNDFLATLRGKGSTGFAQAVEEILPSVKAGNPVMLISGLEADETLMDGVRRLRGREIPTVVIATRIGVEPVDPDDGDPEPEAERLLEERMAMIRKLRGAGVTVYDALEGVPLDYLFRVGVR